MSSRSPEFRTTKATIPPYDGSFLPDLTMMTKLSRVTPITTLKKPQVELQFDLNGKNISLIAFNQMRNKGIGMVMWTLGLLCLRNRIGNDEWKCYLKLASLPRKMSTLTKTVKRSLIIFLQICLKKFNNFQALNTARFSQDQFNHKNIMCSPHNTVRYLF